MLKRAFFSFLLLLLLLPASRLAARERIIKFSSPKMTVYLPPEGLSAGKALVALPGGGYSHLAVNHEGAQWAPFFNQQGLAYAVVEYQMPHGDPAVPMADVAAAFKIMADSAAAWGFKPDSIGIMGSSAGGHLASTMATHSAADCRPAFQILFYPVITMDPAFTHRGSHDNLLGKTPAAGRETEFSSELQVTPETPRALLLLSSDDRTVKPTNALRYYEALQSAGVPASLIIYPTGGHGWGYRESFAYHDNVLMEIKSWLKSF
ncbi:MAG: alpha/beta hydrolase [Staphylococcus sp.]|nr:alpha/beta hydrolase [Staphylococcus sp.]